MNIQDPYGQTPLMFAVKEDDVECANKLIKAGVDVNTRNSWLNTGMYH